MRPCRQHLLLNKLLAIIILAALLPAIAWGAPTDAQLADSAYNRENYTEAVALYTKALGQGMVSPEMYYNLGNAYYRQGRLGQAVIAYERALRLDPSDKDARDNLNFVINQLGDMLEDDTSFLTTLHRNIVTAQSANAWAWTALICFALLCAAAALYIFAPGVRMRKTGFFGGIVMIFVTGYFILVAAHASDRLHDRSYAVVTAPSTTLNSVPRMPRQNEKSVSLTEGTKVQIVDSVPTPDDPVAPQWYEVNINNSTRAWVRSTDVERI